MLLSFPGIQHYFSFKSTAKFELYIILLVIIYVRHLMIKHRARKIQMGVYVCWCVCVHKILLVSACVCVSVFVSASVIYFADTDIEGLISSGVKIPRVTETHV